MLTVHGKTQDSYCDNVSRRNFLKIGALGLGGLTLVDLLRLESAAGIGSSNKAIINIHLGGGPSHQDMFDLKPNAPMEYRGEFNPIQTNVPGMEICELMPSLAGMADKFAVIRALVGSNAGHSSQQTHTGFSKKSLPSIGGRPSIGAVVAKMQGSDSGAPPWVSHNGGGPGYLGATYRPFTSSKGGMTNLTLNRALTADRLQDRASLLTSLDNIRREVDAHGQMTAMDSFTEKAVEIVTSGKVADALDMKKEDPAIIARYGKTNQSLLQARRLIDVGVRVVTMNGPWGNWDTHSDNFKKLRGNLPKVDEGLSALLWDLERLGKLEDVSVVMWGEFGRTPRVNKKAGRDHWPAVAMAWMAGGGMRTGQMVGETTRYAENAKNRPVHFQEVLATLYHNLGVDSRTAQFIDPTGRPQYLLEHNQPIRELV
ncbi:MAG: DUF1501 domain-containing protein [Planctomycetales bacterium]